MNNKITLYSHILNFGILSLKHFISGPLHKRVFSKKSECVAELLHFIPSRLFSPEYGRGDLEFIENELKRFAQEYPDKTDYTFMMMMDACLSLYDEVSGRFQLQWLFPNDLRRDILRYRKTNQVGRKH